MSDEYYKVRDVVTTNEPYIIALSDEIKLLYGYDAYLQLHKDYVNDRIQFLNKRYWLKIKRADKLIKYYFRAQGFKVRDIP